MYINPQTYTIHPESTATEKEIDLAIAIIITMYFFVTGSNLVKLRVKV